MIHLNAESILPSLFLLQEYCLLKDLLLGQRYLNKLSLILYKITNRNKILVKLQKYPYLLLQFLENNTPLSTITIIKYSLHPQTKIGLLEFTKIILFIFQNIMGILDKIKQIEEEIARTQKNKATQYHMGQLKAKLAKYRTQLLEPSSKGQKGEGFEVSKFGNARVCMIGFPSVGKSTLLTSITDTASLSAAYQFTTLTCIPGVIYHNDAKIQLLDLPGIIEGAADGKGRGKQVIAVAKNSDLVLMVLDAVKAEQQRVKLTRELDKVGIRLNRQPPKISLTPTKFGGVKLNSTKKLNHLDEKTVKNILSEYKMHNVEVLIHDDSTVDDLIDVIEGNRKYVGCLYCYNKIDTISMQEVNDLARRPNSVVISCNMKLNFDMLKQKMWDMLDLVRIYTKKPKQQPDFSDPIVLTNDRNGCSIKSVCEQIHRDLPKEFKYAKMWGRSAKFVPQKVGLSHVLMDQDVVQIYKNKTKTQVKKEDKVTETGTKNQRKAGKVQKKKK